MKTRKPAWSQLSEMMLRWSRFIPLRLSGCNSRTSHVQGPVFLLCLRTLIEVEHLASGPKSTNFGAKSGQLWKTHQFCVSYCPILVLWTYKLIQKDMPYNAKPEKYNHLNMLLLWRRNCLTLDLKCSCNSRSPCICQGSLSEQNYFKKRSIVLKT